MNRFVVYTPEDNEWMQPLDALSDLGVVESDEAHVTSLVTDRDLDDVFDHLKGYAPKLHFLAVEAKHARYFAHGGVAKVGEALD